MMKTEKLPLFTTYLRDLNAGELHVDANKLILRLPQSRHFQEMHFEFEMKTKWKKNYFVFQHRHKCAQRSLSSKCQIRVNTIRK